MDRFEKLALQMEAAGEVLTVKEVEDIVKEYEGRAMNNFSSGGLVMRLVGCAMRAAPNAVKQLVALDKDITVEAVDEMDDAALVEAVQTVMLRDVLNFFGSKKPQAKKK